MFFFFFVLLFFLRLSMCHYPSSCDQFCYHVFVECVSTLRVPHVLSVTTLRHLVASYVEYDVLGQCTTLKSQECP